MRKIIAVLVALSLAACGGGGGDPEPVCSPVHVQVFGDSIGRGFAHALQQVADADRGEGRVIVDNRSVGGTSSVKLRLGTDGKNAPWPQGVGADVIFVNHGHNDRTLEVPEDVFRSNIEAFAAEGAIILTTIPVKWRSDEGNVYLAVTKSMPKMLDVNAWALARGGVWFKHLPDGTHPDPYISRAVARSLLLPAVPMCGGAR